MAELLDVSIEIYDWARRYQFVTLLRRPGSSALLVGHSNTITERVDLLGGESGGEIDEVSEHDRRYILTVHEPGKVNTKLIRYGTLISDFADRKNKPRLRSFGQVCFPDYG